MTTIKFGLWNRRKREGRHTFMQVHARDDLKILVSAHCAKQNPPANVCPFIALIMNEETRVSHVSGVIQLRELDRGREKLGRTQRCALGTLKVGTLECSSNPEINARRRNEEVSIKSREY